MNTCLQNASQSLTSLKIINFFHGTSNNMQKINFKQPNSLFPNAFLWLLMYDVTKNQRLDIATDRALQIIFKELCFSAESAFFQIKIFMCTHLSMISTFGKQSRQIFFRQLSFETVLVNAQLQPPSHCTKGLMVGSNL